MDFHTFQTTLQLWSPEQGLWNPTRQINLASLCLNDDSHSTSANNSEDWKQFIINHLCEILYRFDRASIFNFSGDGYLTYREFIPMVYKSLRIHAALAKNTPMWMDPPNYIRSMESDIDKKFLSGLFPEVIMEDINIIKRNFIEWCNDLVERIIDEVPEFVENVEPESLLPIPASKIMAYFESIFERDFLWNFRAVSNTKNLFRSPDPARYQTERNHLTEFLKKNNITSVIDLRGPRERARAPYCEGMLEGLNIECLLVDFNEPPGGEKEPGYVKKLIYQREAIISTIQTINRTSGATLFHCASGKDRTGVMAALLQKIAGVSEEIISSDYLRSGHDARPQRIRDVLNYLKKIGGIDKFTESLEIDPEAIKKLRNKIMLV